jgi:hypothetical protein
MVAAVPANTSWKKNFANSGTPVQLAPRVQEFLAEESPEVDLYVTKVYALSNTQLKGVEMTVEKPFNYYKLHY